MSAGTADFWTDSTSVLFTSLWGWSPETWGTIGWTSDHGLARRNKLLRQLSDPFITACSVTSNQTFSDPGLKGMIAGFYLVSHETGDRDEFTHPIRHDNSPERWRHSLRALRAFSYLSEYRLSVTDFDSTALNRARAIAAMGEIITDPNRIAMLRETPCVEVDLYTPPQYAVEIEEDEIASPGYVKAGPASSEGYVVTPGTARLPRQIYVLRMTGETSVYLGRKVNGAAIYKIGLSVSPDTRRQQFMKSMPKGAFGWELVRASTGDRASEGFTFDAAVTGEYAMKQSLAANAEYLNGEFYLATEDQIETAWRNGLAAAEARGMEA